VTADIDIKLFVQRRDDCLRSLDIKRAKELFPMLKNASNDEVIMATMHKARVHITTMTDEERSVSREWLAEHGYTEEVG
jgi:hypothetical protein